MAGDRTVSLATGTTLGVVRRLGVLVALCFVVVCGVASASRPATEAERVAVADGLGVPDDCAAVTMSTVDGTWARLARKAGATGCENLDDAVHVMHLDGLDWSQAAYLDSQFDCPANAPPGVGADLGLCKQRGAYLLCANPRATARHRAFKPRTCNTLGPKQPFADAVNLAKLRWSGWGKATATARGVDRGFRKKAKAVAVTVRASGRAVGCKRRLGLHAAAGPFPLRERLRAAARGLSLTVRGVLDRGWSCAARAIFSGMRRNSSIASRRSSVTAICSRRFGASGFPLGPLRPPRRAGQQQPGGRNRGLELAVLHMMYP